MAMHFGKKIRQIWLSKSIQKKIAFFIGTVFIIITIAVLFDFWFVSYSMNDLKEILEDNARSIDLIDAVENESVCFADYVRNPDEDNYIAYANACKLTSDAITQLPYDYSSMSELRYAKTWSIKNSYEIYTKQRNMVVTMGENTDGYITELYRTYDMQTFIQDYARTLMRYTLEDGTKAFTKKEALVRKLPVMVLVIGALLFAGLIFLARIMKKSMIKPIMKLGEAAKKIAKNDFFVEDIVVENKDEIGSLVHSFNKMKYATAQYITALEEKRKTMDLLHQEELEKLEMENRLEGMKFELLKNQINPHFLFNTLNVIGGMANLEDAKTTETMIKAMSSLFRYNLKTTESRVYLAQELGVLRDYMYLQKMRFGDRISHQISCETDQERAVVPVFILQPLVENAVIHGLAQKEEGGRIFIRIWTIEKMLYLTVADTGVGIEEGRLEMIRKALLEEKYSEVGIGLGNVYRRICGLYRDGEVGIFSKKGAGTIIKLTIPQEKFI